MSNGRVGSVSVATYWAIMLARDLDTCRALLAGEPVNPDRIDPVWLNAAEELRLVRLDMSALDLLDLRSEEAA